MVEHPRLTRFMLERALVVHDRYWCPVESREQEREQEAYRDEWFDFMCSYGLETIALALAALNRLEPRYHAPRVYTKHKLGPAQQKIVSALAEMGPKRAIELAAITGIHERNLRRNLVSMHARGMLTYSAKLYLYGLPEWEQQSKETEHAESDHESVRHDGERTADISGALSSGTSTPESVQRGAAPGDHRGESAAPRAARPDPSSVVAPRVADGLHGANAGRPARPLAPSNERAKPEPPAPTLHLSAPRIAVEKGEVFDLDAGADDAEMAGRERKAKRVLAKVNSPTGLAIRLPPKQPKPAGAPALLGAPRAPMVAAGRGRTPEALTEVSRRGAAAAKASRATERALGPTAKTSMSDDELHAWAAERLAAGDLPAEMTIPRDELDEPAPAPTTARDDEEDEG